MGFLKGKIHTLVLVSISAIMGAIMSALYIYTFSEKYKDPTVSVKVTKAIGMVVAILFTLIAIASAHAVHLASKRVGMGLYSVFTLASCGLDLLYFSLMTQKQGFIAVCEGADKNRPRYRFMIGFSVAVFLTVLFRLYALMVLWHFDVKNNQTSVTTTTGTTTPAPTNTTATTSKSLPKFLSARKFGTNRLRPDTSKVEKRSAYFELSDADENETSDEEGRLRPPQAPVRDKDRLYDAV